MQLQLIFVKKCKDCGIEKPINKFSLRDSTKARANICYSCDYSNRYGAFISRTKKRGIFVDRKFLTAKKYKELILAAKVCPICNNVFEPYSLTSKRHKSIDRFDSSLGYIENNVIIICFRCNTIKSDALPSELRQIADFLEKGPKS